MNAWSVVCYKLLSSTYSPRTASVSNTGSSINLSIDPTLPQITAESWPRSACPLWVKSRHLRRKKRCPLYPQQRPQKRISAQAHVRFTPKSGHVQRSTSCPLWAKSGLMQCSKKHRYSITSSAATSSVFGTVMPSTFAVFRLITSSNLVGA